jgi:exonuclease III
MSSTCILEPLPHDLNKDELKMHKSNYLSIQNVLSSLKKGEMLTHQEFLDKCHLNNEEYLLAIRSSIDKSKVFLKRSVLDVRTNNYNPDVLNIWRANTDIQFVLDPWAVCAYIASYMMKSQRGMSLLLQEACREAKAGNHSIREKMRIISNKFLNHCEISAQEAIYLLLQMPLTQSSRQVHFVNTSPPDQRIHILKPLDILNTLPDDSTEVTCTGLIERYANRPEILKKITLAEFAAWFDKSYKKKPSTKEQDLTIDTIDSIMDDIPSGYEIQLPDGQIIIKRTQPKILRYVKYSLEKDPENYYREHILLFYPWTEEISLLQGKDSFKSRFEEICDAIQHVKSNFDKYGNIITETFQSLQEEQLNEAMDSCAPATRQSEDDNMQSSENASDMSYLQPNSLNHMEYDIAVDMGIGPVTSVNEVVIKNKISDEEFFHLMRSLNKEQRLVLDHILFSVKTRSDPFHIFMTGGAGVGKSHVLKAVYQALLRYFDVCAGQNPDEIKVIIGATTGKAAFNVNGNTLHTLFNIPANHSLSTYSKLDHSKLNTLRCQYSELKVLIVDEVSMMGSNMFNFVNNRLKEIFGTEKHFGGVSLVLVGDLFQLRPVMDRWIFQNTESGYGMLAPNIWQDLVKLYELQTVMRQKDDAEFAHLLNRIREGNQVENDLSVLNNRSTEKHRSPLVDVPHLFATNHLVDAHNLHYLEKINTEGCISYATDYTIGDISQSVKSKVLDIAKSLPQQKTQNLAQQLQIKITGQYMITHNIDTDDGLTNGATCVVKHFEIVDEMPTILWIKFEDPNIGAALRQKMKSYFKNGIENTWVPLQKVDRQFQVGKYKSILIIRKQFPLKPAFALTIHKSQGISLPKVCVSFQGRIPPHMVYVALSRVTSLSGLFIKDFNSSKIKVDSAVKAEMTRLRTANCITIMPAIPIKDVEHLFILCHNTRSLHAHIADVQSDHYSSMADILIIQETWELPQDSDDDYRLPGFSETVKHCGNSISNNRPHSGTRIYFKSSIHVLSSSMLARNGCETIHVHIEYNLSKFLLISVYKNPRTHYSTLLDHLKTLMTVEAHDKIIFIGDFNVDLLKQELNHFEQKMCQQFNVKQLVKEETTDYHSLLDHIYTNIAKPSHGVLEAYWSDHKRIWLVV